MRSIYWIFILLQSVAFAEEIEKMTLVSVWTELSGSYWKVNGPGGREPYLGDTMNCLKLAGVLNNEDKANEATRRDGISYKFFGITSYCYVYAGFLHELSELANKYEKSTHYVDQTNKACKDKQIVQMMIEGSADRLLLVVDRFGRRVRVQSAVSGVAVESSGFLWMKLAANDRRQHFYSEKIQKGYVIQSFVNINYRVYLVTIGVNNVKLMELRVISDGRTLMPHVIQLEKTDNGNIEPSTSLVTPHIGLFARAVHDLQMGEKQDEKTSMVIERVGSGLAFSHRLDLHKPLAPVIPAIAMESLIINAYYDYRGSYLNSRFLYRKSDDNELVIRLPQPEADHGQHCVGWVNYIMLYKHQVDYKTAEEERKKNRPLVFNFNGGESALNGILKNIYLNDNNMHSRMAYPHIRRTFKERKILTVGWKDLYPYMLGAIGALLGVTGGIYGAILWIRHKHPKNRRVTTSLSNNSW